MQGSTLLWLTLAITSKFLFNNCVNILACTPTKHTYILVAGQTKRSRTATSICYTPMRLCCRLQKQSNQIRLNTHCFEDGLLHHERILLDLRQTSDIHNTLSVYTQFTALSNSFHTSNAEVPSAAGQLNLWYSAKS